MAAKGLQSKYKYLFGSAAQPTDNIGGIALGTSISPESNVIKANEKFIGVPWKGTGTLAIFDASFKGTLPEELPLIVQEAAINEFNFSPFNPHLIATASQDGNVKLWKIPEGGLKSELTEPPFADLIHAPGKRVMLVDWHPLVNNVLLSATSDDVRLWDVSAGGPKGELPKVHKGQVTSVTWSHDGKLVATASKDKNLRVFDPRASVVAAEGTAHGGVKGFRAVWLGSRETILTVGFSKTAQRETAMWDVRNLSKSLSTNTLDSSPGSPLPLFDPDTSVLYLGFKGEGVIKLYEVTPDSSLVFLSDFKSPQPAAGMTMLSKLGVDVMKCEVAKILKLTPNGHVVRLRFEVPRQNMNLFHDDLFPPTWDGRPVADASGWFAGDNGAANFINLQPPNMK